MSKDLEFNHKARVGLSEGIEKLAKTVVCTLGPAGRNVIIEQTTGNPISTKDGVTVAKSIELKDPLENIGAQLVKQASIKTAEEAGDGTTTSTLLAREMFQKGLGTIGDHTAVQVKKGIELATEDVVEYLESVSKDITDEGQLKQVATISANNDNEVGELISTAMEKVGQDGVVSIEESKTGETYLETVEGMQFNRGYKSPYFVTDNSSMQAVLQSPLILITDKKISQVKELLPILEACSSQSKSLLIIADEIGGEALSTLVVNKMRGILGVVAVAAPEFGDRKKAALEDIAVLTGGTVVSSEKGMRLDKFQSAWLGSAKKVTVSKDSTTIIDANGDEDAIISRVDQIKTQVDESKSPYEIETLQDRLAKFIGGVAIVYVGGHTEVEMKEKKDRVDDALHATKAALEEGILPGGGIALLNGANMLKESLPNLILNEDELKGYNIVITSIETPFIKILSNTGFKSAFIKEVKNKINSVRNKWSGFNPRTEEFVNMFEAGIIDPTKVTRLALENAASVSGTMLITEAVVSKIENKENTNPAGVDPNMLLG